MTRPRHDRSFVRTFFTSPTAIEGADDSAKLLRSAIQLRGMRAPDVWVPDNEDATAASMREMGVENIVEVVAENGADFPGEIHPRVVWHRDDPATRYRGFRHMLAITDPDGSAAPYIDGFVIPEVGEVDDWKKADECLTLVEQENGLEEGSLAMSVIVESAQAELALGGLREAIGHPTNNLERLFLLVDGEVDYTKDMRAMTPTGALPPWPELRHNTSRGAAAAGLIAVDGPYDDIRDHEGYRERMTDNQAKGMLGIWSLTPDQVVEANTAPLPPATGRWHIDVDGHQSELEAVDGVYEYRGSEIALTARDTGYILDIGGTTAERDEDELTNELIDMTEYVPSMDDIVDSMEAFEQAKEAGQGAIALERSMTVSIDGIEMELNRDRMWDEATYQAAMTPIRLLQDVYEHRPDQQDALEERYGAGVVQRAINVAR